MHVFRNDRLRPDWQAHTALDFTDLTSTGDGIDPALPTQKASRRRAVAE
ncbi:hypothetical protein ACFC26_30950 [Kitasatospora purpeofusca]